MQKGTFWAGAAAVAAALIAAPSAFAGALTLHPSGFGQHSYAAWKAQQGLPDSNGKDNQALYFQKMTAAPTFAAGVAVIKGLSGTPADELTGLAWDHRTDGHCGAGAPRWNVGLRHVVTGQPQTVFLGCNAAAHTQLGPGASGHTWCRDTQPSIAAQIQAQTGQPASNFTLRGLAIVFDEGTDTPNPPPAGCQQTNLVGGFVHLDNITVEVDGVLHCWTGANDNGNSTASCSAVPATADSPLSLLDPLVGLAVDATDTELVDGLDVAYPGVAVTEWLLYPGVY